MIPKVSDIAMSIIKSRNPKMKLHATLCDAKKALAVSHRHLSPDSQSYCYTDGGGQIYTIVDNEWTLLYDVPIGGPKPWSKPQ